MLGEPDPPVVPEVPAESTDPAAPPASEAPVPPPAEPTPTETKTPGVDAFTAADATTTSC